MRRNILCAGVACVCLLAVYVPWIHTVGNRDRPGGYALIFAPPDCQALGISGARVDLTRMLLSMFVVACATAAALAMIRPKPVHRIASPPGAPAESVDPTLPPPLSPRVEGKESSDVPATRGRLETCAIAAFWCGVVSLAYPGCITGPICAIAALVLGCLGLWSPRRVAAFSGLVLASVSVAALVYMTRLEIDLRKGFDRLFQPAPQSLVDENPRPAKGRLVTNAKERSPTRALVDIVQPPSPSPPSPTIYELMETDVTTILWFHSSMASVFGVTLAMPRAEAVSVLERSLSQYPDLELARYPEAPDSLDVVRKGSRAPLVGLNWYPHHGSNFRIFVTREFQGFLRGDNRRLVTLEAVRGTSPYVKRFLGDPDKVVDETPRDAGFPDWTTIRYIYRGKGIELLYTDLPDRPKHVDLILVK